MEYVNQAWVAGIGPQALSVYRAPCRTNNSVESMNALWKRRLGSHGAIWNLLAVFCEIAQEVVLDHDVVQAGERFVRAIPKRQDRMNEAFIQQSWDGLDRGALTPREFIRRVKYRVGANNARVVLANDDPEEADPQQPAAPWDAWVNNQDAQQQLLANIANDHDYL